MALPLTSVRVDTPGLREYMHRLINFREQCDFEYTFYTMLCLCVDPRRAYRNAEYHSRTKHQWARDDPGFVVVMSALLATSITSWTIAFGPISLGGWLLNVAYTVLVDFVLVGLAIAGLGWVVANGRALASSGGGYPGQEMDGADQLVEFAYAFDIHCNAYFPFFLLIHVAQYAALPLLLRRGFLPSTLSCALWATALSHYCYVTFLGYNALPFLRHTEYLVYPIGLVVALAVCAALVRINPSRAMVSFYFPPSSEFLGEGAVDMAPEPIGSGR